MPRTIGAKNIPKSAEYHLEKLKELGHKFGEKVGKKVPAPVKEVAEPFVAEAKKKGILVIDKPQEKKQAELEALTGSVLRCGNPSCGKILDSEISVCPHCGVKLEWS